MTSRHLVALPLLAAALAGCGALETPDLAHGNVAGRITGAAPGAFVYPLGSPQRKVALSAAGTFELEDLPVGPATLVLFDGGLKAERVVVQVVGAGRARLDRASADMPLAGRVALSVVPVGGVAPTSPRYGVRGTDQVGVAAQAGGAVLFPLPEGDYEVETGMAGFQGAVSPLRVVSGTTDGLEVRLELSTSGAIGCAAAGNACRNGLHCDATDGQCYPCRVGASDCAADSTCDPVTRFCTVPTGGGASPICSVCTANAQCGGMALGGFCEKAPGAAAGYCTRGHFATSGPAGFALLDDAGGNRWVALLGCQRYFEEFGENCFSDATCGALDGIQGGSCRGARREEGRPGYCTAPCAVDGDCIVAGFTCDPVDRVCVRVPDP